MRGEALAVGCYEDGLAYGKWALARDRRLALKRGAGYITKGHSHREYPEASREGYCPACGGHQAKATQKTTSLPREKPYNLALIPLKESRYTPIEIVLTRYQSISIKEGLVFSPGKLYSEEIVEFHESAYSKDGLSIKDEVRGAKLMAAVTSLSASSMLPSLALQNSLRHIGLRKFILPKYIKNATLVKSARLHLGLKEGLSHQLLVVLAITEG
ncbi:hypothetical protein KSP40_PGU003332 [Platanthera guangdongensis]|uniref:Uncharacterized protein n=1 Tax=Platanthera guangdongensis TaxID=2320717 RepID=A0ABR2M4X7_9ASPA